MSVTVDTTASPRQVHYLDDTGPGRGRRLAARSWLHSDAPRLDLSGDWRFRLLSGVPGRAGALEVLPRDEGESDFAATDFDDADWATLPVPSHWVLGNEGRYGGPLYTNVHLPIAQDPPFTPDVNPTGDHRHAFDLPSSWRDRERYERLVLRFDGVESRYRVWLNGIEIGVGSGSRLAQEFDVTDAAVDGTNTLAVRVHQWSASTYVEDQDQWWLPGIFREVTLEARPVGGIDDVWLRAGYDHLTSRGLLSPEVRSGPLAFPLRLMIGELGVDTQWATAADVSPIDVGTVEPWSAETPRLYDATLTSAGGAETIALRVGFRTVAVVGDRFEVNGRRVVLHGVNRHDTDPDRGRAFDEEFVRRDLALMKQHNVNAIRTAHYPPHPRVLDLADEYGLWVMLECDIETHSFHHGGSVFTHGTDEWLGNPSEDPAWRETFLDRIERTVERDKGHASIVMWSLGNESGTGANLAAMADWVHARDPERPVHYEGDRSGDYTDVYSRMYATIAEVTSIGSDSTSLLLDASGAQSARLRTRPFLLCEYVHAMGNGPGGIDRYEELVDRYPRLHGGFVWEWRDHGLRTRTADGADFFGYGGDFGETVVHDGHFCMDGLVLSDGTPTPGLVEFKAVMAPVRFAFGEAVEDHDGFRISVTLDNHRHSADTSDLAFGWVVEHDGVAVAAGALPTAAVDAGDSVTVELQLPAAARAAAGVSAGASADASAGEAEAWLTVSATLAADTVWAERGHEVAFGQTRLPTRASAWPSRASAWPSRAEAWPSRAESRPVDTRSNSEGDDRPLDASASFALGPAEFSSGRLTTLAGLPVDGPRLELWRAPTDNDRGSHTGSYDVSDPMEGRGLGVPGPSHAERWLEAGLDRMLGRLVDLARTPTSFTRRTRWAPTDSREAFFVDERWRLDGNDVRLDVEIVPSSRWTVVLPRVGVRFDLPTSIDAASWFGTGPGESYPDSRRGVRVGRFDAGLDDLTFPYAWPQESGHRSDLRDLVLASEGRDAIRITALPDHRGRRPGFTLARHTAAEVTLAAHQHELPTPGGTYLYLDAAQNGLGSRACGPDAWPDTLLRPESRSLHLRLTAAPTIGDAS